MRAPYVPLEPAREAIDGEWVPCSVATRGMKRSEDALLRRGYDNQFIHPLASFQRPLFGVLLEAAEAKAMIKHS